MQTIICLLNGAWVPIKCLQNDCVAGSHFTIINGNATKYGSLVDVICSDGFNASAPQIRCSESGTWTTAMCTVIDYAADCGPVATLTNGQVSLNVSAHTTYGAIAYVTCVSSFDASTDPVACLSNGSWSWAACLPKDCGLVLEGLNGKLIHVDESNTTFGAYANVTCDSGFDAQTEEVTCLSNGSWSWAACSPKDCRPVATLTNGQVSLNVSAHTS
ncbi:sushi, von Willebrand factor type A, EGF and pentraxin domain-containing protein 1-like [Mya arenaria]|uniref:sushi, von Willebrand factor type A, EGF and pentraxin domain-containing protein 1-like n=1 Tax=Mya arenaria TaxID=6604 RepID=UPI0022E72678|nr:sushi, von Willebrand factor type A, EGF and pentraxin domain-containing protein 1-like [Mya arenaria]XP_052810475.1 sushi, von Willebrand factor type A, EGF and pentraxin domain-containing protein 1-like [Mya arenaria]